MKQAVVAGVRERGDSDGDLLLSHLEHERAMEPVPPREHHA